jgi:hypothetical protein
VEEEMRRSLAFCLWRAQQWRAYADHQLNKAVHVREGLLAYAMEQKDTEEQRMVSWAIKWSAVRERAKTVLRSDLSTNTNTITSLPELVVELEGEDEERENEEEMDDV